MYADDLLLLAASVVELQKMIKLCGLELENINMSVNANKTMCMRVGPKHDAKCANILINTHSLLWVSVIRYLAKSI